MILDFELTEIMRLSSIKRWAIIETSRDQSVAEHSYNVAMISMNICAEMGLGNDMTAYILRWALVHDLPELLTGDIPTPAKSYMDLERMEKEIAPAYDGFRETVSGTLIECVVKAADYVDALQFAEKFCVDTRKADIICDIRKNMNEFLFNIDDSPLSRAVDRLKY